MKPHKHAELIKAWADGAKIERRCGPEDKWEYLPNPAWCEEFEYRIKPHVEKKFIYTEHFEGGDIIVSARIWNEGDNRLGLPIIQVTLTNGKVTAVELTK